jgi:hypothetical protein
MIDRQNQPRKITAADFFAAHAGAFNSLEHDPENACPEDLIGGGCRFPEKIMPTKKSERKPVAAIRTDHELAITFHEMAAPRPVLGILRLLERRRRDRRFFYSGCADRNCACARHVSKAEPSREAEKEQCVTHGYLLGDSPSANGNAPFRFHML